MTMFLESLCIDNGVAKNYHYHLERVRRAIGGSVFPSAGELERGNPYPLGRVKCRVVYGRDGVQMVEYLQYERPRIESLMVVQGGDVDYSHKYHQRGALDHLYAQRGAAHDIIIVKNGMITDSYFCNLVFCGANGGLYTPTTPLLRGVRRQELLDSGKISALCIKAADLQQFQSVYLINSMLDLGDVPPIPINQISVSP